MGHLPCSLWLLAPALWTHSSPAAQTFPAASFQRSPFSARPAQTAADVSGEQSAPPPGLAALCKATVRFSVFKKALPESP